MFCAAMRGMGLSLWSSTCSTLSRRSGLFAGPDYTIAIFEPEARLLLSRIETTAHHYEVRASTASPFSG